MMPIMYAHDVILLNEFYQGLLGRLVNRILKQAIADIWPNTLHSKIVGMGYATPYLRMFEPTADRVLALMPQRLGALRWPLLRPNRVVMVDERQLPLADQSVDRILMVHMLENTPFAREMLREAWRVLRSEGRLLVCVPNRVSLWAQMNRTPFALGDPYTPRQLSELMMQSSFMPSQVQTALFTPPVHMRMIRRYYDVFERTGRLWHSRFGGMILLEGIKKNFCQVERGSGAPVASRFLTRPAAGLQGSMLDSDSRACEDLASERILMERA